MAIGFTACCMLQGVGIKQLSMAQLDVLEELHHAALSAIAARRMDLVGAGGYHTPRPLALLGPAGRCRWQQVLRAASSGDTKFDLVSPGLFGCFVARGVGVRSTPQGAADVTLLTVMSTLQVRGQEAQRHAELTRLAGELALC